jgi:hypothetical protein
MTPSHLSLLYYRDFLALIEDVLVGKAAYQSLNYRFAYYIENRQQLLQLKEFVESEYELLLQPAGTLAAINHYTTLLPLCVEEEERVYVQKQLNALRAHLVQLRIQGRVNGIQPVEDTPPITERPAHAR